MMLSMRYWLVAYQLVKKDDPSQFTELAAYLFDPDDGKDPYLEDINTLWLLHWKLCTLRSKFTYDGVRGSGGKGWSGSLLHSPLAHS